MLIPLLRRGENQIKISKEIDEYNAIARIQQPFKMCAFINIYGLNPQWPVQSRIVARDGLHPSGEGILRDSWSYYIR